MREHVNGAKEVSFVQHSVDFGGRCLNVLDIVNDLDDLSARVSVAAAQRPTI